MSARILAAPELTHRCNPASLTPETPANEPQATHGIVGQERASAAVEFGIGTPHPDFHLFVMGPPGSGRRSLVRRVIEARVARSSSARCDWVYVNNFERPHQPVALQLPAGMGTQLRNDMRTLVRDLRTLIPAAFESEEYATQLERINDEFKEHVEQALGEVAQQAQARGLAMLRTPSGFSFAPQKDGEMMSPEAFHALPAEQREALQKAMEGAQEHLLRVLRNNMRMRKDHVDRVRALDRTTTLLAVDHALDEIKARYAQWPRVVQYLQAVHDDVVENAGDFRAQAEDDNAQSKTEQRTELARYEVNLVLDAADGGRPPIVEADLPSCQNLVGRVDHIARFGALLTDFRLVKGGQLHKANGGYLIVDALKLLQQPFAWAALKRALLKREIRIESPAEMYSVISTVQLEPEPIPLQVKVALVGERWVGQLLQAVDPEFDELFRVLADLGDDMPRAAATERELGRLLLEQLQAQTLLAAAPAALARVIDHGSRLAGDAARITAQLRRLLDVLVEADHLARAAGHAQIEADDVTAAIAARRERTARVHERLGEAVHRGILMIDTAGQRVGQVNGLAAYEVGNETFGAPTRITATSRLGDGEVVTCSAKPTWAARCMPRA